ncbi:hypothetical protein [Xanthomonas bromi]|uniref:hypothetical protein n=1 Tax=Xanthomonas bromi TaxID=56449 RepID=UPI0015E2C959|nr:hypothetical protein [Xanthomonas bromi]
MPLARAMGRSAARDAWHRAATRQYFGFARASACRRSAWLRQCPIGKDGLPGIADELDHALRSIRVAHVTRVMLRRQNVGKS